MPTKKTSPIYHTPIPGSSVSLYEGVVELLRDGVLIGTSPTGVIKFDWYPQPRARVDMLLNHFDFEESAEAHSLFGLGEGGAIRLANGVVAPVKLTHFFMMPDDERAEGYLTRQSVAPGVTFKTMCFHLANFNQYNGSYVASGADTTPKRRFDITLQAGDYTIELDCYPEYQWPNNNMDALRTSGGYALTHHGYLKRQDDNPIDATEAEELIEALSYFFSFCRGRWSPLVLSVGLDMNGERVWEDWRLHPVSGWEEGRTWFPISSYEPEHLSGALNNFLDYWKRPDWQQVLRTAIAWYVQSNTTDIPETAAAMVQVGLELLAWVILIEKSAVISKDGFERLSTSDCLRLVLHQARVPLALPPVFVQLGTFAKGFNITTGPEALIYLRNAVIHPTIKNLDRVKGMPPAARAEATTLGICYLELSMLYFLGYTGKYYNKLETRKDCDWEQPVPWII